MLGCILATVFRYFNFNGPATVDLPDLANQGGAISASNASVFTAPKLVDAASITTSTTAAISLKSVATTTNYTASATIEGLTATAQATSLTLGFFPGLKSATITGGGTKSTAYAVSVNVSSTVLANLTIDGVLNTFLLIQHLR